MTRYDQKLGSKTIGYQVLTKVWVSVKKIPGINKWY